MSYFIGIDGGLNGGISIINENQDVIFKDVMPVIKGSKTEFDIYGIVKMITNNISNEKVFCMLEKAAPRPISGKRACFMTGGGYYLLQGILTTLGISYEVVNPTEWQKEIFKGLNYDDTKQASVMFCQRKWPTLKFTATERSSKAHDGITDSLCIALYCLRKNIGGG
jgi:hypothetical protein